MRHKHRILHYWMLVAVGACVPERNAFRDVFGYKCAISKKNLLKAQEHGLWIFWFMTHFVGEENEREFEAYISEQLDGHMCEIGYDFHAAHVRIIDKFLLLFENNRNEYYWSEHPF